jgi:hypothetical protein
MLPQFRLSSLKNHTFELKFQSIALQVVMDPEEIGRVALEMAANRGATAQTLQSLPSSAAEENTRRRRLFASADRALMRGDTSLMRDMYDAIEGASEDGKMSFAPFKTLMQKFLPGANDQQCKFFMVLVTAEWGSFMYTIWLLYGYYVVIICLIICI